MRLQNIISENKKWLLLIALIFCFSLNNQIFAQSDRESVIQETERMEIQKDFNSSDLKEANEEHHSYSPKKSLDADRPSTKTKRNDYREDMGAIEDKKEDKSPVSFNIFLYVLDRFKEN